MRARLLPVFIAVWVNVAPGGVASNGPVVTVMEAAREADPVPAAETRPSVDPVGVPVSPPTSEPVAPPPVVPPAPPEKQTPSKSAVDLRLDSLTKAARLQILLARSGFSPGLIDGKPGRKTKVAIEAFQRARGLPVNGTPDDATLTALGSEGFSGYRNYRITAADLKWITGPIPEDWNERAALERSGYADMEELLSERGWCSIDLVRYLNSGVSLNTLAAGDEVILPDVDTKPLPRIARVEVDLGEKMIQGFNADGVQVMLLHCSIARLAEKRPVGSLQVKVVAMDPEYTFDPKDWPEVPNMTRKLRIAPGPRCPVGAAWVGLDKPGYGMHGTIRPQDIGKTGSHGCFRLCNWDAVRLAKAVRIGTTVDVKE